MLALDRAIRSKLENCSLHTDAVNTDTVAKNITGETTVKPKITGYANSSEGALDWSSSCTDCGARIGSGGYVQTVVISGYGFGTDPGSGSRDTASNSSSSPWSYVGGTTCGANDWWDATAANAPVKIKCCSDLNNKRYYRYKIQLCSYDRSVAGENSPLVTDVVIS